jgi:hypothetical protein
MLSPHPRTIVEHRICANLKAAIPLESAGQRAMSPQIEGPAGAQEMVYATSDGSSRDLIH